MLRKDPIHEFEVIDWLTGFRRGITRRRLGDNICGIALAESPLQLPSLSSLLLQSLILFPT